MSTNAWNLEKLDALIDRLERWWAFAHSRKHAPRRRRAVTATSRQRRKTPRPHMLLRWGKGLEIDATCWCKVYLYETTRRASPWSADRESVTYATLDSTEMATVRAWIAENPGPPGWGGYRPAVRVGDSVYALDYNDWVSLRGWTCDTFRV